MAVLLVLSWFGLSHANLLLDTKGVLTALGGGNSTKVQGIDLSCRELICGEFSDIFEKPGTPPERVIKYKIDLLPDSVPPAKRQYRMSLVELSENRKQLDEYLSKGWIRPSTSPPLMEPPFFLLGKRIEPLGYA